MVGYRTINRTATVMERIIIGPFPDKFAKNRYNIVLISMHPVDNLEPEKNK